MQRWDEGSDKVSRIAPDREKAKALLRIIDLREKSIGLMKADEFSTLVVEEYYDIIKELITAIMSADGWKTLSHEMLIGYLARFYREFSAYELNVADQLRKTRNDITYRGVAIRHDYLARNEKAILHIIDKLKRIVHAKIR